MDVRHPGQLAKFPVETVVEVNGDHQGGMPSHKRGEALFPDTGIGVGPLPAAENSDELAGRDSLFC